MGKKNIVLAQLGCGYWGPNLLRNFSNTRDGRVKYVVEMSPERRQFVEANYPGTQAVNDTRIVLQDPEVDAIVIATPAATHYALAKQALESGKHIFVEKPLAMSVAQADELIRIASARQLILMAGHTFLYNGAVNYLRDLIQRGELGQIFYLYAQRLNLGVIRSDINSMWNLAPHDISILMYLLNQTPLTVSAWGTDYIQPGIEDVVFMNLTFPEKIQASIQVSWLDPNKIRKTTVVGSRKMVVYDDVSDDKITIYDKGIDRVKPEMPFDEITPQKLVHRAGDILLPKVTFKEPLKVEAAHFIECIQTGQVPLSGPENARAVVAVLEAGQESLKNKGRIIPVQG